MSLHDKQSEIRGNKKTLDALAMEINQQHELAQEHLRLAKEHYEASDVASIDESALESLSRLKLGEEGLPMYTWAGTDAAIMDCNCYKGMAKRNLWAVAAVCESLERVTGPGRGRSKGEVINGDVNKFCSETGIARSRVYNLSRAYRLAVEFIKDVRRRTSFQLLDVSDFEEASALPDKEEGLEVLDWALDNGINGSPAQRSKIRSKIKLQTRQKQREAMKVQPLPPGQYRVFYADPPWEYSNSGFNGAAEDHYPTMKTSEICELPIVKSAADNAVLFLWATNPLLPDALEVMKAWGFSYKTNFVWLKDKSTYGKLGFYNYGRHELLLLGTRGSYAPVLEELPESVIEAEKNKHSKKPVEVYSLIERMYPDDAYVELFCRQPHEGWEAWGNEV